MVRILPTQKDAASNLGRFILVISSDLNTIEHARLNRPGVSGDFLV